jgi:GNAT superfamily N-acetyltransferase
MTRPLQASAALVESLSDGPFYWAITEGFENDVPARKEALNRYLHYSLEEAERTGRCVVAPDPTARGRGLVAASLSGSGRGGVVREIRVSCLCARFPEENYYRIASYMAPLAARVVPGDAWYSSILGIRPSAQGRGLGATLLAGTLAEASQCDLTCYLETFTPRNLRFYERLGFRRVTDHFEPTTNKERMCSHAKRADRRRCRRFSRIT